MDKPAPKKRQSKAQKITGDPNWGLAKFIIDKFLDIRHKQFFRDGIVALRLAKKYNSKYFWANLPCEFRVKNLSLFLMNDAAKEKLKMLWIVYQNNLNIDKKLAIPARVEYKLLDSTPENNIIYDNKPKTIYDFCKN